jgi:hypothetical protein
MRRRGGVGWFLWCFSPRPVNRIVRPLDLGGHPEENRLTYPSLAGESEMKRLTSFANLLLLLALLTPVTTAQSTSDWQRDNLVGSVRSMQVEFAEANAVDGKLVEIKRWPHQRVTYNERGQEVERVNFNQNGTEQDRSVIRYDSEGRIIGYGDAKKDRYHSTIEYDSKGNRIEARMYERDVIQTREVHTYDDIGYGDAKKDRYHSTIEKEKHL